MTQAQVGIIGGTGLGDALMAAGGETVTVQTPFGPPSQPPVLSTWEGVNVAFLSRHGPGHRFNPSHVPYRANVWALKSLGVTSIIASGAVGSLREEIKPGHLVVCDQVIDKTHHRDATFFDEGIVAHVEFAEPFCPRLRTLISRAAADLDMTIHHSATYVCMEGPQFSTRAEAHMHRQWGGDLIGMTCMPEAKLAREAEICYALVALPTDYDCWRPADPARPGDDLLSEILANLRDATERAIQLIRETLRKLPDHAESCSCKNALKLAIWSDRAKIDAAARRRLDLLIGRYNTGSPAIEGTTPGVPSPLTTSSDRSP